jgi:sigma-54 specific flagellar transcriptional regulator A
MSLRATAMTPRPMTPSAFPGLIHGAQSPLVDTKRTCARVAASEATVLLTGETGTGKEVFARFIHAHSPRASRPFVPVNCGAIPETLLESELFGYVKGAFTGAVSARRGRVAMAEGGTLFLDEIGELPLSLQVKLLRLLQEKTYEPVGSSESVAANFRLVAATNRDLADEVRAGRFRSDLYYRLHVCPVRLPALRERRADVAPLFFHFWSRRGDQRPVEPAVIRCLEAYAWPGNVRELENLVERVSVCAEGDVIRVGDLPPGISPARMNGMDMGEIVDGAVPMVEAGVGETESSPIALLAPGPTQGAGMSGASSSSSFTSSSWEAQAPRRPESAAFSMKDAGGMEVGGIEVGANDVTAMLSEAMGHGAGPISLPSLAAVAAQLRAQAMSGAAPPTQGGPEMSGSPDWPVRAAGDASGNTPTPVLQLPIDLPTMLKELETAYINAALTQTRSNKKEAARLLGMGRTTLVEKLRRRASDRQRPSSDDDGT